MSPWSLLVHRSPFQKKSVDVPDSLLSRKSSERTGSDFLLSPSVCENDCKYPVIRMINIKPAHFFMVQIYK